MILFLFVNCPGVKKWASRLKFDNIFFGGTYCTGRYFASKIRDNKTVPLWHRQRHEKEMKKRQNARGHVKTKTKSYTPPPSPISGLQRHLDRVRFMRRNTKRRKGTIFSQDNLPKFHSNMKKKGTFSSFLLLLVVTACECDLLGTS